MNGELRVAGNCDGVKGDEVYGWAWHPDQPDLPVVIELLLDGALVDSAEATLFRADVRASGMGNGRYGWRIPLPRRPGRTEPLRLLARVRGGGPLDNGEFEHSDTPSADDIADPELAAFTAAVTGTGPARVEAAPVAARPVTNLLLFSVADADSRALGAAEYSYGFVLKAFRPLLERLGRVHMLDGSAEQVDAIVAANLARGEATILFSFAPPHRTPLSLRCPIVPVVAWEFPTIPDRGWAGEPRHDWTFVLRQTGRALALCETAAAAMRVAMGADFPAVAMPTPVWDRRPDLQNLPAPAPATLSIDGFVLDTRGRTFDASAVIPAAPAPDGSGAEPLGSEVALDGVVFTAVLAPKDGRKNWNDILTAFIAAFADEPRATLVFKMIGTDPGLWWWEAHELLGKQRPFACRVVFLHGFLEDDQYAALVAATHWIVCASKAEGQCLPLLEFMIGGRPCITPLNTAMLDYAPAAQALVVDSCEEYCGWPHDPRNEMTTTRHRIVWSSLRDRLAEGFRMVTDAPDAYAARGAAAQDAMRRYCGDDMVAARLDSFLGLGLGLAPTVPSPSPLLRELAG